MKYTCPHDYMHIHKAESLCNEGAEKGVGQQTVLDLHQ